jgi:FecR protein
VNLGARFANELSLVSAPDAIWPQIDAQLQQGRRHPIAFSFAKPLAIAASLLLLVGGALLLLRNTRGPALASWRVSRLNGTPRIGSAGFDSEAKLGIGQWLETDATSRAQLDVANIGHVEIDPNSRVRLIESKPTEHRLELQRGRLSARISAPPKLFFVNTPSGVAEDLGCAYTLEVDDEGNSVLHVTLGWVSLQTADGEPVVPAGAACATRKDLGPGTPYFEDASEGFRAALAKFDFASAAETSSKSSSIDVLLREARARDTMTLWYLLPRVNNHERARVYDRMTAIMQPPKGVTRDGILNLDQSMMNSWKAKLGLSWGQADDPISHGGWNKLWSAALGRLKGMQGKR